MTRDESIARRLGVVTGCLAFASLRGTRIVRRAAALALGVLVGTAASAQALSFGVVPQRTAILTAQYWNPILHHVSARSGVALELSLSKSGPDHAAAIARGGFDLAYTNHHLSPAAEAAGYRAFARPIGAPAQTHIVVLEQSPLRSLDALQGKEVGFASRVAFFGYQVPMDGLLRAGIRVVPVFGGTQEGILGQLRAGSVAAASVNSQILREFAAREKLGYRVLWRSEEYFNIPLVAHPRVSRAAVASVLAALLAMTTDPEGAKVLAAGAELLKLAPPVGFVAARDSDYDNARRFLRSSLAKAEE